MTRALLLPLLLTAAASAQVVVPPAVGAAPEPAPVLGLSGLDCSAGATATVGAPGWLASETSAPMVRFGTASGATIPNVCRDAAPLTVLPDGVRFRTDPLPLSEDDDLGRQLLRELATERYERHLQLLSPPRPEFDQLRLPSNLPEFERLRHEPMVAPLGQRP